MDHHRLRFESGLKQRRPGRHALALECLRGNRCTGRPGQLERVRLMRYPLTSAASRIGTQAAGTQAQHSLLYS